MTTVKNSTQHGNSAIIVASHPALYSFAELATKIEILIPNTVLQFEVTSEALSR